MRAAEETCWTLIRDAADGNAQARDRFARLYLDVVRAYLGARWGGRPIRQRLDDAVQDVFLECLKSSGALTRASEEHEGRFHTYLYAVTRNVALRHEEAAAKDHRRWPRDVTLSQVPAPDEAHLSRTFDRAWAESLLRRAADRMRAEAAKRGGAALRHVELLNLRFRDGLPIREIARRWGQEPADLHRQYAKAREGFARALRQEVAFCRPGSPGEIERRCRELLELFR